MIKSFVAVGIGVVSCATAEAPSLLQVPERTIKSCTPTGHFPVTPAAGRMSWTIIQLQTEPFCTSSLHLSLKSGVSVSGCIHLKYIITSFMLCVVLCINLMSNIGGPGCAVYPELSSGHSVRYISNYPLLNHLT